jgi:SP family general alpha glucoside:H+ symporter-like MFS transporter
MADHITDEKAYATGAEDVDLEGHDNYPRRTMSKDDDAEQMALVVDAKHATDHEHSMTAWEGVKRYRKACFWSLVFSLCIVMDGYDTAFTATLYAEPAFQKQFGQRYAGGGGAYQIAAGWQTAFGVSGTLSNIVGVFLDGYLSERLGRKLVTLGSLVVLSATIFCQFFAQSLPVLLVGRMLAGVPIGVFQASTNTYAAEICPVVLRAYLTTYVCLCWVIGQFICAGVTYSVSGIATEWSYKIIFAVQWAWPLPIFLLILFAPESPWWLVRRGRLAEAERAVARLTDGEVNTKEAVAMMVHTTQLEAEVETGSSYASCFRGTNLRRTEIACFVYGIQAFIGNPLQGYTTYFFEQAGLSSSAAFKMNVGNNALSFVGTILAWPLLYFFGRRAVYFWGLAIMTILYVAIGCAGIPPLSNTGSDWAKSSLLIIYLFVYCPSVGATVYTIVGEVGAANVRGKTVALARSFYCIWAIISGVLVPYMLNPTQWNWGAKSAFFFAGLSCVCLAWTFYRLPEMKDRTYEEIDLLFGKRLPARKFKNHEIDAYAGIGKDEKL